MKLKRFLRIFAVTVTLLLSAFFLSKIAISKCSKVITKGKTLYMANCQTCHGNKGKIHHINRESKRSFLKRVLGKNNSSERAAHNDEGNEEDGDESVENNDSNSDSSSSMPSFKGVLKKNQVKAIYKYLRKPKKACSNGGNTGGNNGGGNNGGGNNGGGNNGGGSSQTPTYTNDISAILSANCTSCHNSSYAAKGVRLDTYSDAVANASAMKTAVDSGIMPPGGGLSASDVATIDDWVANGTPQ